MAEPQAKPVLRYDVDDNQLKTGATIRGFRARNEPTPHADDRVQELTAYQAEQRALDNSEKDLTAEFKDAEAAFAGGARNILEAAEGTFTGAILQKKANSAQAVEDASLSPSELQARDTASALADILEQRGLVPESPDPGVDELDAEEDIPAYEPGLYTDDTGSVWEMQENGAWAEQVTQSDDADEEPADFPDQWRDDGLSSNEFDIDLTDNTEEEEEYDNAG
jgi:hypothetical protein